MNGWFLLDDGPASGAENMAVDEFLLRSCEGPISSPVLRLYHFDPPAITVGYHQKPEEILDLEILIDKPVDVVRRVTGGRALLHWGELTYAVSAPLDYLPLGKGLRETYLSISRALACAMRNLGLDIRISDARKSRRQPGLTSPCLVSTSRDELNVGGRKLVASSQRRTNKAFIQHGSILITRDSVRITDYLEGDWEWLGGRITSLSDELDRTPGLKMIKDSIKTAFRESFDIRWLELEFSRKQKEEIIREAGRKRKEFSFYTGGVG